MTFDYISDIHLDFHCKQYSITHRNFYKDIDAFATSILPEQPSSTLLIAGDLGHRFEQDSYLLLKLRETYDNILLVPGNHDFYLITASIRSRYSNNSFLRIKEMKDFCSATPGLHYLDGDTVTLDSITYSGCGMSWDKTHYELLCGDSVSDYEVVSYYKRYLNDYRNISCGTAPYTILLPYGQPAVCGDFDPLRYFNSQYDKLYSVPEADVVLTHYAPLLHPSTPEDYRDHLGTSFYYFDGSEIISKLKPKVWVFGHTHTPANDLVGDTTYLCNPFGYPKENIGAKIVTYTKEDL